MLKSQYHYTFGKELKVYDMETLTVAGTAVAFTAAKLAVASKEKAIRAWVTVAGADVRYRVDGTAPTAAVGHAVENGGTIEIEGQTNLERFRIIAQSGTATVTVSYSRYEA